MTTSLCAFLALGTGAESARGGVEIATHLDRSRASAGESVALEVTVRGAGRGAGDPVLRLPSGLALVNTSRAEGFSWVNNRPVAETVFHLEIAAQQPGRYTLGPVRVLAGRQTYQSGREVLVVTAGPASLVGESGDVWLVADLEPRDPWAGQPVILRVRLIQSKDLDLGGWSYTAPATPGFWSENRSRDSCYDALQNGRQVSVVEKRTRLYPLGSGVTRIGPAVARVKLAQAWSVPRGGMLSGSQEEPQFLVQSQPIEVHARPLPAGAPSGFGGAVGSLVLSWSADRARTSQDVPVTVRLDMRGTGNLPLMQAPTLVVPGGEVFSGTTDDSLALPGTLTPGRRRFQWNVLPRQQGTMQIFAPSFAWLDPTTERYRSAALAPVRVDVGPPFFSSAGEREAFPGVFLRDAPDPFSRGVAPWMWALTGLLAGAAIVLWRTRPPTDPHADERSRVGTWRNALRAPAGTAFWRAAEEVAEWLERRSRAVSELRALIAATRYGGGDADADAVRLRLGQELAAAVPPLRSRRPTRLAAVLLGAVAVVVMAFSVLGFGETANSLRLRAADQAARSGDLGRARSAWEALWREGARAPALAARLAWMEAARGALGPAAVWVLRGEEAGARDPALAWASDLVREGGGLTGERTVRLPVRRTEWAVLALALGLAAGVTWPRRWLALVLALLAVMAAGAEPAQDGWAARAGQAVVTRRVTLEGTVLELETGQVVRVLGRDGPRTRVRVGQDLDGRVPPDALLPVRAMP